MRDKILQKIRQFTTEKYSFKDVAIITIMILAMAVLALIEIALLGLVFRWAWNLSMPTMFGFETLNMKQATAIVLGLYALKTDYKNISLDVDEYLPEFIKIVIIVFFLWLSVVMLQYAWNFIIPETTNIDLTKINFVQAMGAAIVLRLFTTLLSIENKVRVWYEKN